MQSAGFARAVDPAIVVDDHAGEALGQQQVGAEPVVEQSWVLTVSEPGNSTQAAPAGTAWGGAHGGDSLHALRPS